MTHPFDYQMVISWNKFFPYFFCKTLKNHI